jgi:hypothetical protein
MLSKFKHKFLTVIVIIIQFSLELVMNTDLLHTNIKSNDEHGEVTQIKW